MCQWSVGWSKSVWICRWSRWRNLSTVPITDAGTVQLSNNWLRYRYRKSVEILLSTLEGLGQPLAQSIEVKCVCEKMRSPSCHDKTRRTWKFWKFWPGGYLETALPVKTATTNKREVEAEQQQQDKRTAYKNNGVVIIYASKFPVSEAF